MCEQIIKAWIIVHEPGKVPEKKSTLAPSWNAVEDFLIQLALCRPAGTRYTIVQLTWDYDIWVSEGAEELAIARLSSPRRFAQRVRSVAAKHAAWLHAEPERVAALARGRAP